MAAIIKTIEDMLHNKIYPKTKVEAVYDDNNNRLDSLLSAKEDASDDIVLKGTSESVPSISDPILHQTDISTTQSTATNTVPSSSLVKGMNDSITQLSSDIANLSIRDYYSSGSHDANNFEPYSVYLATGASTAHLPSGSDTWLVATFGYNNNYKCQFCFRMSILSAWVRYCNNGSWYSWKEIASA